MNEEVDPYFIEHGENMDKEMHIGAVSDGFRVWKVSSTYNVSIASLFTSESSIYIPPNYRFPNYK